MNRFLKHIQAGAPGLLAALIIFGAAAGCAYTFDNPAEISDKTALSASVSGLSGSADKLRVSVEITIAGQTAPKTIEIESATAGQTSMTVKFSNIPSGSAKIFAAAYAGLREIQKTDYQNIRIKSGAENAASLSLPAADGDVESLEFEVNIPEALDEEEEEAVEDEPEDEEEEPAELEEDEIELEPRFEIDVVYRRTPIFDGRIFADEWPDFSYFDKSPDANVPARVAIAHDGAWLNIVFDAGLTDLDVSSDALELAVSPGGATNGKDAALLTFSLSGSGVKQCWALEDDKFVCSELTREPVWSAVFRQNEKRLTIELKIELASLGVAPGAASKVGLFVRFKEKGKGYSWPNGAQIVNFRSYALLGSSDMWLSPSAEGEETTEASDGDVEMEETETPDETDEEIIDEPLEDETDGDAEEIEDEETLEDEETEEEAEQICVAGAIECVDKEGKTYAVKCSLDGLELTEEKCDDDNACTNDSCNTYSGCFRENNTDQCDDGKVCTILDVCSNGKCEGEKLPENSKCDDGNSCTKDDYCSIDAVCAGTPIPFCCPGFPDMVKIRSGETGYCVDKFEASAFENADCTGAQYGISSFDFPAGFPNNVTEATQTTPVYSCSVVAIKPTAFVSFPQAKLACANSGKRLCSTEEWKFSCADGTSALAFPYGAVFDEMACNDAAYGEANGGTMKRACGELTSCAGSFGVFDMSGNVREWASYNGVTPRICGGYFGTTSNYSSELSCPTTCTGAPSQYTANKKIGYRCCVDSPN